VAYSRFVYETKVCFEGFYDSQKVLQSRIKRFFAVESLKQMCSF